MGSIWTSYNKIKSKSPTETKAVNTTPSALNFPFPNRERSYEAFRYLCISTVQEIGNDDLDTDDFLAFLHGIANKSKSQKLPKWKKRLWFFHPKSAIESTRRNRNKHDEGPFSPLTVRLLFTRPLQSVIYCISSLGANKLYRLQALFVIYRDYVARLLRCLESTMVLYNRSLSLLEWYLSQRSSNFIPITSRLD